MDKRRLVDRIIRRLRTPAWADRFNRSGLRATLNELLPRYLAKLDDLPAPARPIIRGVVRRADVGGFLVTVFDDRQVMELDPEQLGAMAAALLTTSWKPVALVLGANLAFVGLVFVLSRL